MKLENLVAVAAGRRPADLLLKNGKIVNVLSHEIQDGDVAIYGDRIAGVGSYEGREVVDLKGRYVCPGFIDGHVHIESAMLSVPEFARVIVTRGTTAVIADPHEIANVMGTEGIRYILRTSKYCPVYIYIMLSSCVPASHLESAGAELDAIDLLPLLQEEWVLGLAEVMNFPGVIHGDPGVMDKLRVVGDGIIDGHAPGVVGRDLMAYAAAGIRSDHESTTLEEARAKLRAGLMVMIREGSAARNLDALLPLVTTETADRFIFVTDDKHIDDLLEQGQIDHMIKRAIKKGIDPITAVRIATRNPAEYFGLRRLGAVIPGNQASLAILDDFETCRVHSVYKDGRLVAQEGTCLAEDGPAERPVVLRSTVNVQWLEPDAFQMPIPPDGKHRVHIIEAAEGQIHTGRSIERIPSRNGLLEADPSRDLLKLAVVERHRASGNIGLGLVRGFGLKSGAIASSVAHDAHNLVVTGTNDGDMLAAVIHLIRIRGGLCAVENGVVLADVPLPIAGLMSSLRAEELTEQIHRLRTACYSLGSKLERPFMTLAFMSLSVIGSLKVTDQGLIDVDRFERIDLFTE